MKEIFAVITLERDFVMNKFIFPFDLRANPSIDKDKNRDVIIDATKEFNKLMRDGREHAKLNNCYYCGIECDGFCNSHTVPRFCLKNIAKEGKVFYSNTILDFPLQKKEKGINEAGAFRLICQKCDNEVFQDYENPDNYEELPSVSMLAQIDMKNNLKNISKRLIEKELYDIMPGKIGLSEGLAQRQNEVNDLDLKEYKEAYIRAKKCSLKPFPGDYYIGYYTKLPYVVPIAFQGTISLIFDLEGNVINNVYKQDPKYKIKYINLCIFPLKEYSVVMIFVDRKNERYSRFFKQLKKINSLEEQLSVINYILFLYSEDYFLSPNVPQNDLKKLTALSAKTSQFFSLTPLSESEFLETVKANFDFHDRNNVPNLLLDKYAVTSCVTKCETVKPTIPVMKNE